MKFNRFAREIKGESGASTELFSATEGLRGEFAKEIGSGWRRKKIVRESCAKENPAAAVETVLEMVDLKHRCGEAAMVFAGPGERIETGVDRASSAAAMVEVNLTETNNGGESFSPVEGRKL